MIEYEMRPCGVEGIDELMWIKEDRGAWSGPLEDWKFNIPKILPHIKKFDTVIQAGGCCGMYPVFYANYFKNVYTFEPDLDNFNCLKQNCENIPRIRYLNAALGDTIKTVSMRKNHVINVGMHTVLDQDGDIQLLTLDSLGIENVDLIHLDLEGYEEKALRGAKEILTKWSPVVIVERDVGKNFLLENGYIRAESLKMDGLYIKNV